MSCSLLETLVTLWNSELINWQVWQVKSSQAKPGGKKKKWKSNPSNRLFPFTSFDFWVWLATCDAMFRWQQLMGVHDQLSHILTASATPFDPSTNLCSTYLCSASPSLSSITRFISFGDSILECYSDDVHIAIKGLTWVRLTRQTTRYGAFYYHWALLATNSRLVSSNIRYTTLCF